VIAHGRADDAENARKILHAANGFEVAVHDLKK
jgi:alpha-beta hydrolase superfamily lysophospholipase